MPLRRALLSAVTLFGGHFLNRRLDRVVLIGTLLMLVVMAQFLVPYALLWMGHAWALQLPLILFGGLALLSAVLTFRDARLPIGEQLTMTTR